VGRTKGDKHEGARPSLHHTVTCAQRQLPFEDVKNLLDLAMLMAARVEARGDRKFEHGAPFGVLSGHEEIHLRAAEGNVLRLTWL